METMTTVLLIKFLINNTRQNYFQQIHFTELFIVKLSKKCLAGADKNTKKIYLTELLLLYSHILLLFYVFEGQVNLLLQSFRLTFTITTRNKN